jgi:membrane protease YdiL (CAAX protease family)
MRAVGTIGPAPYRFFLPLGFTLMALLPVIFFSRRGRIKVGFVKARRINFYMAAVFIGSGLAFFCWLLGDLVYSNTSNNWFVSIHTSYLRSMDVSAMPVLQQFIIFTVPAVIFSPVGEEIFFRGFLQESLATKLSYRSAMIIESAFFALVHLFHHGIVRDLNGAVHFYPLSGFIWMLLMFTTAMSFAWLKLKTGSIYPPIIAHVMFNLVMNASIFFL